MHTQLQCAPILLLAAGLPVMAFHVIEQPLINVGRTLANAWFPAHGDPAARRLAYSMLPAPGIPHVKKTDLLSHTMVPYLKTAVNLLPRRTRQSGGALIAHLSWVRAHGRKYTVPRFVTAPQIYGSTFPAAVSGEVEVHMLVCRRYFLMALWAAASCICSSTRPVGLCFHDDGSLGQKHSRIVSRIFPGARYIPRKQADAGMASALCSRPHTRSWRESFPLALKLLDCVRLAQGAKLVILDSDVLFCGPAYELWSMVECASGTPGFMEDVEPAYSLTLSEMTQYSGFEHFPSICSGIVVANSASVDFDFVEEMLAREPALHKHLFPSEQTLWALLGAKNGFKLLSNDYAIAGEFISANAVARHYVRGIRAAFWTDGIPRVAETLLGRNKGASSSLADHG